MHRLCLWLLSSFALLFAQCWADAEPYYRNDEYNEGAYGRYVQQEYKTSDIAPPRINFMQPFNKPECDDGSYIFVAPRGNVPNASFYIMDSDGSLLWGPDRHYGEVYNFQVQKYKGEDYLVFWAGDDSIGGHGEGKYYMLDKHYEEHASISAGDGIRGDLHAFTLTDDDTAIYTGYEVVQQDLTIVGRANDSWIWESLFQELDIMTGEVLFEWRASQHFSYLDVYVNPNRASRQDPWDYFHINMVEKDDVGNYLVSTRYGRCVIYIDGSSGEILWYLGGKRNSFKDLSDGNATVFLGQHDAHWYDGHNYITMFDNRGDWFHKIEDLSKGHKIKMDLKAMTAKIEQSYIHPAEILSTSQGSMQILPSGNVLMGYGFNGVFTEFTADGKALCDAYMLPSNRFGSGDVQSYRNLKFNWTGIPLSTPKAVLNETTLYMSWLGSTKLHTWLLQDSDVADGEYRNVQTTPKVGFETEYVLSSGKAMRHYVRAVAVDENGKQLSISNAIQIVNPSAIWPDAPSSSPDHDEGYDGHGNTSDHEEIKHMKEDLEDVQILLVLGILAVISGLLVVWLTIGKRCIPFRAMRGEKQPYGRFSDDGMLRSAWERVKASVPFRTATGPRRGWKDFSARTGLLGHQRDDSEDVDTTEYSMDDARQ